MNKPATRSTRLGRMLTTQGISPPLAWGFLGLTLFMVGDGLEQGFLAPYLTDLEFSPEAIAALFSVYGIVVAISAWLAGALAEAWGPRRVMLVGAAIWVVLEVTFMLALMSRNYSLMLVAFGIRGLGYPLFAYGFLVWVTTDTPDEVLGKAVGWYWFFWVLGLGVLSAYIGGILIPIVGELGTLWLSLVFVAAGTTVVTFLVRARAGNSEG